MRKKIEERVPAIAEVEKRKCQLEDQAMERAIEIRNVQDQLKDALRKNAKMAGQLQISEKRVKDLELEVRSNKERMQSLRKLNQQ